MLPHPQALPDFKSDIVIDSEQSEVTPVDRLKGAYVNERAKLELTEVELNRSRIVMIDQNGKFIRIPFLSEH
ncbi:hypothetical protein [Vibrio hangzhouensis]|uniref:Uncharacterized protein n=1 Tax=Vibrio hangzhouensis TaxID=462991 RepID=A0A1H5WSV3_9VIBR|nr:hypothetical protein [Vibrio hangzhouensis]SEG02236.1 hypothetical protein SAMN04488244_10646 [Vibrio hangzhouensis]